MCPPDFYGIHYEINPWMSTVRQSDHALAVRQWHDLRGCLEAAGAEIAQIDPVDGLPDMVFTANAGLVFGDRVILSRFKHPQRAGEEPQFQRWFEASGFEVSYAPGEFAFEGAGDALFCGETLFAGYRQRSDAAGQQQIGEWLGVRVLLLELVNPAYYHLDTCFCPLAPDAAIWFPDAFDEYGQKVIEENVPTLIAADPTEAAKFACNAAVVIGQTVVTNALAAGNLHEALAAHGFQRSCERRLGEFVKAGGSAKCLTLRLDGEDAAAW